MNRALVVLALASCGGKLSGAKRAPIVITVGAPGFSAADVETAVTSVIESAVADVPGVEHIRSESRDGQARIAIELVASAEPSAASDAVKQRVSSVLRTLPSSVYAPTIQLGWRTDAAVARYTLTGPFPMAQLRETAAHRIAPSIEMTNGVAGIELCGGADPAVMIYVDPALLAGANATVTELEAALKPLLAAPIKDLVALKEAVIAQRGAAIVRLSDVAIVSDDHGPIRCNAVSEHADAVIEGIVYAQSGADPETVRTGALAAIDKARAMLPPAMVLDVMPGEKPAALLGLTAADLAPAARVDQLRKVRDALLAAGAQKVVLAEGVRDPMTGLAETDIEIRFWPASVEPTAVVKLEEVQGVAVARADAKIIAIRGPELAMLHDLARAIAQHLSAAHVGTLGAVGEGGAPRLELRIDRAAAADLGVPVQTISETFRAVIDGIDLGEIALAGKREPVTLTTEVPNHGGTDVGQRIQQLRVPATMSTQIPLTQVAAVSTVLGPATIYHVDRERWLGLRIAGDAVDVARKVIAEMPTPPGYRVELE